MTPQEPGLGELGGLGGFAAPPQLPPPVEAYRSDPGSAPAGAITPVQEVTRHGLRVRWDGTVLPPSSVLTAVHLMWAGAVLDLLLGIVSALRAESVVTETVRSSGVATDPGFVDLVGTGARVGGVVGALVTGALWMWMATANGSGRAWARVVASVFYAVALLSTFVTTLGRDLVALLLVLPGFVVGSVAVVLLWLPASSQYYDAVRRRRR